MSRGLLIVDVQNDFTEGGALAVQGGAEVARRVSAYLMEHASDYEVIAASRDWHDADGDNGGHFALGGEPDFTTTWPVHCVAGTTGAAYHPEFETSAVGVHIHKGQGRPAYSAFEGTTDDAGSLAAVLVGRGVTELDVTGIATDHCVRVSALDALDAGLRVRVLTDLVAGVAPGPSAAALQELADRGAALGASG